MRCEYIADYGRSENLSYTFNVVNQLTAVSDADANAYGFAVTNDANGNST